MKFISRVDQNSVVLVEQIFSPSPQQCRSMQTTNQVLHKKGAIFESFAECTRSLPPTTFRVDGPRFGTK